MPFKVHIVPPPTLKSLLVHNRVYDRLCSYSRNCIICPNGKPGDCTTKDVVYRITCVSCSSIYIGETGRPLRARIAEHVRSIRSPVNPCYADTPWAKHVRAHHGGAPVNVHVSIMSRGGGPLLRKVKEANLIRSLSPSINCKSEVESFGLLLTSA